MSMKRKGWAGTKYVLGGVLLLAIGGPTFSVVRTKMRLKSFLVTRFGSEEAKRIDVAPVSSAGTLARQLEEAKVVSDGDLMERYLREHHVGGPTVTAGEYEFKGALLPSQVADTLAKGERKLYPFTVKAGERLDQLLPRLAALGAGLDEEKLKAASRSRTELTHLGLKGAETLEGFLFPGDYGFPKGITEEDALAQMVKPALAQLKATPAADGVTLGPVEAFTLASLVEQELAPTPPAELKHLSCVFHRRLKAKRALESEASVRYAQLLVKGEFPKGAGDRRVESPFNTFLHDGLPPGPVAAVDAAGLEAALAPADCSDDSFVAGPDGRIIWCPEPTCHAKTVAALSGSEEPKPPPKAPPPKKKKKRGH